MKRKVTLRTTGDSLRGLKRNLSIEKREDQERTHARNRRLQPYAADPIWPGQSRRVILEALDWALRGVSDET